MDEKEQKIFDQLPKPPEGSEFSLVRVQTLFEPHPFCITARHVGIASDHFGGMLGEAALDYADKHGAGCGMKGCQLRYSEHKSQKAVVIAVSYAHQKDLNSCPGLHAYLKSIKEQAVALGIEGFAFPTRDQL